MSRKFTQQLCLFYALASATCWIAAWKMGGEWLVPLVIVAVGALILALLWGKAP